MKKAYTKPVIYCENFGTGEIITNSQEFKKYCEERIRNNQQVKREIQKIFPKEEQ